MYMKFSFMFDAKLNKVKSPNVYVDVDDGQDLHLKHYIIMY